MNNPKQPRTTRTIEIEVSVAGTPEEAWETLTDPAEIRRWFPLDARVDPEVGGKIWLSWGPGVEGEAPIHVWDKPHRFGWTESYGEDEEGRAIEVAVDFHIETRGGSTVVRLVQSGFSASSDWDEMYDTIKDGWTYFMFNLAFYIGKHRGKSRGMVWRRVATDLAREMAWERLIGGALVTVASATAGANFGMTLEEEHTGTVVSARPGHHFAGTLPAWDGSILFVEFEGKHVGIWLSTYGQDESVVERLQAELDERLEGLLDG